ncbi:MAG: histidine ammonia-lyase [Rhodothermales bacterium]|nr:histidine ammonia-lyase [Rhodothermales bacterium]
MMTKRLTIANLHKDLDASLADLRRDTSAVEHSRRTLEAAVADGEPTYGVNTGFGKLAQKRIAPEDQRALQRNLLLSHAVGVGEPVPRDITRLMLRLKIHALGLGYSGVSPETFNRLLELDEAGLVPVVPSRGSVGASGDLAPLAHLALPLIGHGWFWDDSAHGPRASGGAAGRVSGAGDSGTPSGQVPAAEALQSAGLGTVDLQPKDGLSLINGTQLMSAYGAWVLHRSMRLVRIADILAGMSLEALQGSIAPFDARVHEIRPHRGQIDVASNVRTLLRDSEILESHRDCGKVQDPYCLRCVPQVHGASRDALSHAVEVVETEINSVTDNPLVFDGGDVISGGNFHGQPLALALDYAGIALAELASISERRIYLLLAGHDGLPELLMRETGINSGFMIPQYTAAALVSENKVLAHPASVDSIPTSLGQEDHVSMGAISALKLFEIMKNVEYVFAIELLTVAQALDYRRPLRPGRGVEIAHDIVRDRIPHREADYLFQDDLHPCLDLVRTFDLQRAVEGELGALA